MLGLPPGAASDAGAGNEVPVSNWTAVGLEVSQNSTCICVSYPDHPPQLVPVT